MEILLYHELLHVGIKEDGEGEYIYSVNPHEIEDFKTIINQYGMDWAI
jgi:hypothetical protein